MSTTTIPNQTLCEVFAQEANNKLESVEDFLRMMDNTAKATKNNINGYASLQGFVLKHGYSFGIKLPMPPGVKRGKLGNCFKNAAVMSFRFPDLIYVEGYATTIYFPMHHAWCINRNGEVIDPTWRDGSEYFGVPIKAEYLRATLIDNGHYGIIDAWQNKWPILHAKPSQFKERKFKL